MGKKEDKEIYRLWYEFLKRSPDYKEYCEWNLKKQKNSALKLPAKFVKYEGILKHHVASTYNNYGDIHSVNFETWWKSFQKRRASKQVAFEEKQERPIEYFSDYFDVHAKFCIERYEGKYKRQPTFEEFVKYFPLWLKNVGCSVYPGSIILMVRVVREDPLALASDFKKIVTKNKRIHEFATTVEGSPLWHYWSDLISRNRLEPTNRYLRIEELWRYLDVYDLRDVEKMKWSDIAKRCKRDYTDPNVKRALRMDYEKAKRIIGYAERGFFPGNYEKAAPKKRKARAM